MPTSIAENQSLLQEPPFPWTPTTTWAMGGLFQVGYAENSDLLLVLSSQGRGIFDCSTGERIARDYEDAYSEEFFDPVRLMASGFGPLANQSILMAGLFGGGFTHTTADGWFLEEQLSENTERTVFLTSPTNPTTDGGLAREERFAIANDAACELRTYGFSETGRSFVVALSCNLIISNRPK